MELHVLKYRCGYFDKLIQCKFDATFLISFNYDINYYMCCKHSVYYIETFSGVSRTPLNSKLSVML